MGYLCTRFGPNVLPPLTDCVTIMVETLFVISSEARNLLLLYICRFKIPRFPEMTLRHNLQGEEIFLERFRKLRPLAGETN